MERDTSDLFKEFKELTASEFFRRNKQMLGFSGKIRSLTKVFHELITNSLDACEEAVVDRCENYHILARLSSGLEYSIDGRHHAGGVFYPLAVDVPVVAAVKPVDDRGEELFGHVGISKHAMLQALLECIHDAWSSLEVHVGNPHGNDIIARALVPFH